MEVRTWIYSQANTQELCVSINFVPSRDDCHVSFSGRNKWKLNHFRLLLLKPDTVARKRKKGLRRFFRWVYVPTRPQFFSSKTYMEMLKIISVNTTCSVTHKVLNKIHEQSYHSVGEFSVENVCNDKHCTIIGPVGYNNVLVPDDIESLSCKENSFQILRNGTNYDAVECNPLPQHMIIKLVRRSTPWI